MAPRGPRITKNSIEWDKCRPFRDLILSKEVEAQRLQPTVRGCSASTVDNRMKSLIHLHSVYTENESFNSDLEWTRDTDALLKFIDENWSTSTEGNSIRYRTILCSTLRHFPDFEKEREIFYTANAYYITMDRTTSEKVVTLNTLSAGQMLHYMDWEEIIAAYELASESYGTKAHAVTSLYVLFPPRRSKDYFLMKLSKNGEDNFNMDNSCNYLELNEGDFPTKLIFNQFKTTVVYGQQIFEIPKMLGTVLKKYMQEWNVTAGDWLFTTDNEPKYELMRTRCWAGTPFVGSNWTHLVGDCFQQLVAKRMKPTLLRHSFITYKWKENITESQRTELAWKMAHSVKTQAGYVVHPKQDVLAALRVRDGYL